MRPAIFLRTASVLTFIHAVLHTIGGVFGDVPPGAAQTAVLAMKANQFPVMGVTRSYWDFHLGFGLALSIFMLVEAVVFWLLGSLANSGAVKLRPIIAAFLVGYLALAVNSWLYFFIAPVVNELLIAACLAGAMFTQIQPRAR